MDKTKKLDGEWTLISLEPGTCTDRAARQFAAQAFVTKPTIHYLATFEEGVNFAKKNPNTILLLPHLHKLCSDLECDSEWKSLMHLVFPLENPPIYLAENRTTNNDKSCAALNTLRRLYQNQDLKFIDAENTQRAANMAADGQCHFCITNQEGLEKYHLAVVKELKKMTVLWVPYIFLQKKELKFTRSAGA